MNIFEVCDAWIRAARPTQQEKDLAQERLGVCEKCPFFKTLVGITYCEECICPIEKKIFSKNSESCKHRKWKR